MSGDPIEFRAAKSGLSVADWLAERNRREAMIYAGAAAVLLFCAVLAVFGTYGIALGVLLALNAMTCGVWRSLVVLLAFGVVAGLFVLQRQVDGDDLEPVKVDAGPRGVVALRLSRLTGNSWLMFLDNPSADFNPVIRFGLNVLLLAPRLARLSGRMWSLSRRMRSMDVGTVGAGLDAMMQSGGRIPIGDLLQEFPSADPQRFLSDLTAVDGVILLSSSPPGLTIAPSLTEEFEAWKKDARRKRRTEGY
ncbi:MAG TPA: hypothetical protein VF170_01920 [Planctomycetaceae bacterium]